MARYRGETGENVAIRPLDKGIIRDRPGQIAPNGSFYDIQGFIAGNTGLFREPGYTSYAGDNELEGTFVDMMTLWKTDGTQVTFILTTDHLYKVGILTGYQIIPWTFTSASAYIDGIQVYTDESDLFGNWVREGDFVQVAPTNDIISVEVTEAADNLGGEYFNIDDEYYAWYDLDGGSSDPAVSGKTGIEVDVASGDSEGDVLSKTVSAIDGNGAFSAQQRLSTTTFAVRRATSHDMSSADSGTTNFNVSHQDEISDYGPRRKIVTVSGSQISAEQALGSYFTLTNIRVVRSFKAQQPSLIDFVVADGELIFASPEVPLLVYNDSTEELELFIQSDSNRIDYGSGPIDFQCECVTFYNDRLFVGHTIDSNDGDKRQRIRWSTLTDKRDFSDSEAYLDLPYVSGQLKRLVPMGNILVAYFDDGIFFGTTSDIKGLPLSFQQVETGGNGLVGSKAVVSWLNGHFFVGQDDIYYLSNKGPERIGSTVVDQTLGVCQKPWRVYVVIDPVRYRVVFGFPLANDIMENLWSYEYRSEAWSYRKVSTWMVANPMVNTELTWDDLTGSWDNLSSLSYSWDDLNYNDPRRQLYVEYDNKLYQLSDNAALTFDGSVIDGLIETQDYDFDAPDELKTATRLSLKITETGSRSNPIVFTVKGSTNRGRNWKDLGKLKIRTNADEGYVNFAMTGSTFRFRLETDSEVLSYTINEMVARIVPRGRELSLGTQGAE